MSTSSDATVAGRHLKTFLKVSRDIFNIRAICRTLFHDLTTHRTWDRIIFPKVYTCDYKTDAWGPSQISELYICWRDKQIWQGPIRHLHCTRLPERLIVSIMKEICSKVAQRKILLARGIYKARKFEIGLRRQFCSHKCTVFEKWFDLRFYALPLFEIKFYV